MKTIIKSFIFIVLFFLICGTYWSFVIDKKVEELKQFSKPFMQACNNSCIIAPEGWMHDKDNAYFKDNKTYIVKNNKFTIIWHIATDTYLVAQGGKDMNLNVEHVIEEKINWNTYEIES